MVLATNLRMMSPTTIPLTPSLGFCRAVMRPNRLPSGTLPTELRPVQRVVNWLHSQEGTDGPMSSLTTQQRQIPLLAQTTFGPLFLPLLAWPLSGRFRLCKSGRPKGWVGPRRVGPEGSRGPNLEKAWGPEAWGPEVGARRVGGPKFHGFFRLPPQLSFFLPLLGVFSWNFGGGV